MLNLKNLLKQKLLEEKLKNKYDIFNRLNSRVFIYKDKEKNHYITVIDSEEVDYVLATCTEYKGVNYFSLISLGTQTSAFFIGEYRVGENYFKSQLDLIVAEKKNETSIKA